jgi:hypothetical protein
MLEMATKTGEGSKIRGVLNEVISLAASIILYVSRKTFLRAISGIIF